MTGNDVAQRNEFYARLRRRRNEIEEAVVTRIYAVADPSDVTDPEYVQGLRASVASAIEYGLDAIETGAQGSPPVPPALRAQAQSAARNGVPLATVFRRYFAGYILLIEFMIEEAESDGLSDLSVGNLLRGRTAMFDRLIAEVDDAYRREASFRPSSVEQRRLRQIRGLLAGERLDTSDIAYDFDAQHVGLIATGDGVETALGKLGEMLDRRLLRVQPSDRITWVWFGGRRPFGNTELKTLSSFVWPSTVSIGRGECATGMAGWRLTHWQASAALSVALRTEQPVVQYRDVTLLAAAFEDELLVSSLRRMYLEPLEDERDGGEALRSTLRAYFSTGRNVTSTAELLDVSRPTVSTRLTAVKEKIGRSLDVAAAEMEVALRLDEAGL